MKQNTSTGSKHAWYTEVDNDYYINESRLFSYVIFVLLILFCADICYDKRKD